MMRKSAYEQTLFVYLPVLADLVLCLFILTVLDVFGHFVHVLYDVCLRCLLVQSNTKGWLFSSEKKVAHETFSESPHVKL